MQQEIQRERQGRQRDRVLSAILISILVCLLAYLTQVLSSVLLINRDCFDCFVDMKSFLRILGHRSLMVSIIVSKISVLEPILPIISVSSYLFTKAFGWM